MSKANGKNDNKMSRGKILIAIGSILSVTVITVLVVVIVSLLRKEPEREKVYAEPQIGGRGTVVTEDNIEEVMESLGQPSEDGSFTVEMTTEWDFPSGKKESTNAYVANSTANKRTVYFDVILNDTNELVYSSPYIPVGAKIAGFALDSNLEEGQYAATVVYHLVDDDNNEITTSAVSVIINIKS